MTPEEADAKVELATVRYDQVRTEADAALEDLLSAYADAAGFGRTAEELAQTGPFTADYIRERLRERGA